MGGAVDAVTSAVSSVADVAGQALPLVSQVAAVVPGPWQIPAIAFNTASALSDGNIIGAGLSAFGGYSAMNPGVLSAASGPAALPGADIGSAANTWNVPSSISAQSVPMGMPSVWGEIPNIPAVPNSVDNAINWTKTGMKAVNTFNQLDNMLNPKQIQIGQTAAPLPVQQQLSAQPQGGMTSQTARSFGVPNIAPRFAHGGLAQIKRG